MHFVELNEENQLINITCNRTCGSCYRDFWAVLIGNSQDYIVSNATRNTLRNDLPELQMQSYDAPDPDTCSDDQMVSSTLNIKLNLSAVGSTPQDILVSCSVGYGYHNEPVHTRFSAIILLPSFTAPTCMPSTPTAAETGKFLKDCSP